MWTCLIYISFLSLFIISCPKRYFAENAMLPLKNGPFQQFLLTFLKCRKLMTKTLWAKFHNEQVNLQFSLCWCFPFQHQCLISTPSSPPHSNGLCAPKYSLVKGQYSNGSHPQIIALRTKPAHLPKHMLIKGAARSLWGELTGSREWHRANLHTDRYM